MKTVPELVQELSELRANHEALERLHGEAVAQIAALQGEVEAAKAEAAAAEAEKANLAQSLSSAESKIAALEAAAKTADQRAREIAAAAGVQAPAKSAASVEGAAKSAEELHAEYQSLMKAGKNREAAEFWEDHGKAIFAIVNK